MLKTYYFTFTARERKFLKTKIKYALPLNTEKIMVGCINITEKSSE